MAKKSQDTRPARRGKKAPPKHDGSSSEKSDYQKNRRAKKLAEGNKSKGCSRLMMVLFIPFVAVAAYWFLKP